MCCGRRCGIGFAATRHSRNCRLSRIGRLNPRRRALLLESGLSTFLPLHRKIGPPHSLEPRWRFVTEALHLSRDSRLRGEAMQHLEGGPAPLSHHSGYSRRSRRNGWRSHSSAVNPCSFISSGASGSASTILFFATMTVLIPVPRAASASVA